MAQTISFEVDGLSYAEIERIQAQVKKMLDNAKSEKEKKYKKRIEILAEWERDRDKIGSVPPLSREDIYQR